jgi:2-polyprenyl-3-methyl-5-hydroxy-6-metoxy-1,4-benzoquinol methylase
VSSREHWETVYGTKTPDAVSWFQPHAELSLKLIRATGVQTSAAILDVGGGASTLVDDLLDLGHANLTVLDLSATALTAAQSRLGARASAVHWQVADVTTVGLDSASVDVWHDRAVFHFLTTAEQRAAYVHTLLHAVKAGGHVIVATFAEDGPEKCSGLPVMRYSASALHAEFGAAFTLITQERESHTTPFGAVQQFTYCYFRAPVPAELNGAVITSDDPAAA